MAAHLCSVWVGALRLVVGRFVGARKLPVWVDKSTILYINISLSKSEPVRMGGHFLSNCRHGSCYVGPMSRFSFGVEFVGSSSRQ